MHNYLQYFPRLVKIVGFEGYRTKEEGRQKNCKPSCTTRAEEHREEKKGASLTSLISCYLWQLVLFCSSKIEKYIGEDDITYKT